MDRFYVDISSLNLPEIILPSDESKHIVKVLRKQIGDELEIVNGKGELFVGKISSNNPKTVVVERIKHTHSKPDNYHIHIAIAPTKNNDRLEWFLEKVTELGIHEITPILCDNSERKVIKTERLNKIIVAAMKQSKREYLPQLNELTTFKKFIAKYPNGLIAHCYEDESRNTTIFKELNSNSSQWKDKNTPILIGPEGDFSLNEVKIALENGYQAVTLGSSRLRTETAGIYACMNLKLYFEEKE